MPVRGVVVVYECARNLACFEQKSLEQAFL